MRIFILLSLALLLGGCQSFNEMLPDEDSSVFEPPPLDYSVPATSSGGLYRQGYGGSLYQDKRAVRVGDILTIVLDESTQSSKSAGTSFGKKSGVGIDIHQIHQRGSPHGQGQQQDQCHQPTIENATHKKLSTHIGNKGLAKKRVSQPGELLSLSTPRPA